MISTITVYWLWLTICQTDTPNAKCNTERHMCVWEVCAEIIRDKKPVSMIRRPV